MGGANIYMAYSCDQLYARRSKITPATVHFMNCYPVCLHRHAQSVHADSIIDRIEQPEVEVHELSDTGNLPYRQT